MNSITLITVITVYTTQRGSHQQSVGGWLVGTPQVKLIPASHKQSSESINPRRVDLRQKEVQKSRHTKVATQKQKQRTNRDNHRIILLTMLFFVSEIGSSFCLSLSILNFQQVTSNPQAVLNSIRKRLIFTFYYVQDIYNS